jgi:hypothetical protein
MLHRRVEHRTNRSTRPLMVAALALLVTVGSWAGPPAHAASPASNGSQTVLCAFSNPAYSGLCKESVPLPNGATPQQACQSVLNCLNNSQCEKTYCNATTQRGGWKLESASVQPSN